MSSMEEIISGLAELGPQGIARFQASLDPEWIEEALAATGTASLRRRRFPAEQAIWLVLGMAVFEDRSIEDVVEHLNLALPGSGPLAKSAIPKARKRIGPEPMEWLFRKVADAWSAAPGCGGYHGLRLLGIDGTCMRVQDSDENFEHFGKPASRHGDGGGYPQLRMTALLDLSTRIMADLAFGPFGMSEVELAEALISRLPANSLTLVDRGFYSYKFVADAIAGGDNRHVLARLRTDIAFEHVEVLADGSQRVRLIPNKTLRQKHSEYTTSLDGRVITYQHPGGEPSRLFTTLLNPDEYPANELIRLYHDRWELELAFDELKTHMLERRESLRSKSPKGVEQEVWGLFLVYNLVRREMFLAAEAVNLAPNRISFWTSLLVIRNFWVMAWHTAPGTLPRHLASLRSDLGKLVLPKRRSDRRYPRHVKIKMSNYNRNRRTRGPSKAPSQPEGSN